MLSNQTQRLRPSFFSGRSVAALLLAGVSSAALYAQQPAKATATNAPATDLFASNSLPSLDLATVAGVNYSSSSSSVDQPVDAAAAERLNLGNVDVTQPPPRRRYGNPHYNDSSHNSDGSNKYAFVAAGGFTLASGNTYHYYNTGYAFQVGGGRNFNKHFSVLLQYDYDHFGLNGATLTNQETVYNYDVPSGDQISGLDGNAHIWSFTLNPSYSIYQKEGLGAYVVAGVGFYHKVTNFTLPETGVGFSPLYGEYEYTANEVIDHYSSNAPGFNAGFGLTYKPSRFAGERLFAEVRYVFIDNSHRSGQSVNNINDITTYNQFPANSNHTEYFPIKAGIRF